MAVPQEAADAAERVELPRSPNPAPYSFPRALWRAARSAPGAWKVRGTVYCDETFVSDGTMMLRRDLIRGPLPDWLEHSPEKGLSAMPSSKTFLPLLEERLRKAVDLVDTVLRHPQMGTPIAGGPTVRYQLGDEEIYLSGGRLWLAQASTGAGQLWASSDDPRAAVVAGRGRTPTAAIMPLRVSSYEDFEPWEEA